MSLALAGDLAARVRVMHCPICKKTVEDDGPNRSAAYPFCSERCKLIDLGRWLDGKYQIPVEEPDESASPDSDDPAAHDDADET